MLYSDEGRVGTRRVIRLAADTFPHSSPQTGHETFTSSGFHYSFFAWFAVVSAFDMATFTECDEVFWCILTTLPAFKKVVNIDIVFVPTITALVVIPLKDVVPDIASL